MAYTAATGFRFRKSLHGPDNPMILKFRAGNSVTLTHGDAVRLNNAGLVVLAAAGNPVLGIVHGITDELGGNLLALGYKNNTGATLTGDDTVATASDNSTRTNYIMVEVEVDPAGSAVYYNDADGNLAQTNLLQFFDVLAASDQIDSSSASDTSGQFQLVALDPDGDGDLSKGLWRIAESQLITQVGNSTAVIAA